MHTHLQLKRLEDKILSQTKFVIISSFFIKKRCRIKRACNLGARIAEPGEYTKRAFLNNKLDLVQAEAVGDLINSKSEEAALHQNKNLSGSVSSDVLKIQKNLLSILSSLEFEFDVSEGEALLPENVNNCVKLLKNSCLKVGNIF